MDINVECDIVTYDRESMMLDFGKNVRVKSVPHYDRRVMIIYGDTEVVVNSDDLMSAVGRCT